MNVVLHHGLFGFRTQRFGPIAIEYFRGIAETLRAAGHNVWLTGVNPIGGIVQRSRQLRDQLRPVLDELPGQQRIVIIGHSMGGLDARHLLATDSGIAARVAELVTLATPHRGSPVADFVMQFRPPLPMSTVPNPVHLFGEIFRAVVPPELPTLPVPDWVAWLGLDHEAIPDLTTASCSRFNACTPNRVGVRYFWIACNCAGNVPPYFLVTDDLVSRAPAPDGGPNDGVVAVSSAEPPQDGVNPWHFLGIWHGIDHLNAVNMRPPGDPNRPDVSPRYIELLNSIQTTA